ncbi:MAG: SusC/RagA family TonB-linked outer membrane protein [Gemmatimonadetes bacterium]|nr:SusC/RagA family TonB-linked outer membrane protein [Gemmatimonadota bacterium]
MAMVRNFLICLTGTLLCALPLSAQTPTGTITGRVLERATQRPLTGVSIVVDGTTNVTVTSTDGRFILTDVQAGARRVTAGLIGYATLQQDVTVIAGATANIEFALESQALALDALIVTGYGTQRRLAITGSVATIDADVANVGVISNANDLIQGRVAGVHITQNSGEPGAAAQVRIRGGTSISASNEPLYVIDGMPINNAPTEARGIGINSDPPLSRSPLGLLNPSDIESITILKDAAATAIYGSRAANGVILIQTKQGTPGRVSIEYDGYLASSRSARSLDLMSGAQYRQFVQELVAGGETRLTERLANIGTADTDWEGALTRTGLTHNHNLSFAGGGADTRYRASINYMNQEGVVISNGIERLQGRLNASHGALDGRLRLGLNLTTSQVANDYLPYENTGGFEGGVFTNMVIYDPTRPVMISDPSGTGEQVFYEQFCTPTACTPSRLELRNPVAMANQIADFGNTTRTLGNVTAAFDLVPGVTANLNVGGDRSNGVRRTYLPRVSPVGFEFEGRARQVSRDNSSLTLQTFLTAQRRIADQHDVELVGGYEYAEYSTAEFGAEGRGFSTDAFSYHNLGGGNTLVQPFSWREESKLVSFFSRANYSLEDRYFLTGVLRYDGSSRFGEGNKWALFPAVSASWRLSEEQFMRDRMFSDLRLRVGYGLQGNPAVPPYASLITLGPGGNYVFGNQPVTGISPNRNPNPDLKWEETAQFNVALDYGFSDNRYSGSIEYYTKTTTDLLLEVAVPQPALVSTRLENIGEIRNRGVELALNAQVLASPRLSWLAGLVFAAERNEVVNLGGRTLIQSARASGQGQSDTWTQRIMPGQPLGTFFGAEFAGVDANGRQLFNQYNVTRDADGREISRELIGQTTSPGGDDFVILGNANPDFTLGLHSQLNYGSFDLSFLLRSEVGQEVFNNTALVYATKGAVLQGRNFLSSALEDGVGIDEPAIYSSRWIEDGSFLRVQNITLGYVFNLPNFSMRDARVYVSADNLLMLTGYSGYDPEVHTAADGLAVRGVDYLNYTRPRTFTTGVSFAF